MGGSLAQQDAVIAKLDTARTALAEAKTIQDVKKISDIAGAAEVYARQQQLGDEAIGYAHAIKIEAMRRLGEMLKVGQATGEVAKRGQPKKTSGAEEYFQPEKIESLGITHKVSMISQKLAELPKEQFDQVREGTSSMSKAIREAEREKRRDNTRPMVKGKYRVIYADPPWSYNDKCDDGSVQSGGCEKHYPSLTISGLCDLPIVDIAEESAVLFLWVTSPLLFECEPVIKAWGFEYKSSFVWDKVKHNMGHYNSVRHEFLLVCTRGSCTPDVKKLYDSVQTIERTEHSRKPEFFREIIDTIYPHGNRVELFARGDAPKGWKTWGNEA